MEDKQFDVVVFGSCMIDLLCYAPRLPNVGETIHGTNFEIGNGGKGANQCVAAAKLGATTALIARLGDDYFGKKYVENLTSVGVNVDYVTLTEDISSGMAQITVSEKGENHIVIVSGANNKLCFEDAKKCGNALLKAKVVLFQMETPLNANLETLKYLRKNDGPITIVNAAPAISNIDKEFFKLAHIFCVNETEAEIITGMKVTSVKEAFDALTCLLSMGCNIVVITMGAQGSVFGGEKLDFEHVPTDKVDAIDSTGAGDAFLGALAYFVGKMPNISFREKIRRASKVATYSVLNKGTQKSYPLKSGLPAELFE